MALHVSHACFRGSYMEYNSWIEKLCEVAGYGPMYEWEEKKWPDVSTDPLIILLSATPYPTKIEPAQCAEIMFRLKEILPSMARAERLPNALPYSRITSSFIVGMRKAVSLNEPVTFK